MLAEPRSDASRLAAALTPATLATVRRGRVVVAVTRAARVELRVRNRGRIVRRQQRTVQAGVGTLGLPGALPPGVVELSLRAIDERGAVASHRLGVLGTATLPLRTARRALLAFGDDFDTGAIVRCCGRQSPRRVACELTITSDAGSVRGRASVAVQRGGWLLVRSKDTAATVAPF